MNKEITKNQIRCFLTDLAQLTKKYNIVIDGCGCCGSPYLKAINGYKFDREKWELLDYDEKEKRYSVGEEWGVEELYGN